MIGFVRVGVVACGRPGVEASGYTGVVAYRRLGGRPGGLAYGAGATVVRDFLCGEMQSAIRL